MHHAGTDREVDGGDVDETLHHRLVIHNLIKEDAHTSFIKDLRYGLTAQPKRLSPKHFYDELGSQLFEAICLLPEYYLTRAENEILTRHADEITDALGCSPVSLLEMGSGSATKTRRLIEALLRRQADLLYTPVDISRSALEQSARVLLQSYPALRVQAYAGDYYTALAHISETKDDRGCTLALFLGSNIGNFDLEEAQKFLRSLRDVLRTGDAVLIGADLKKDAAVLEAAYDDALGITAAFNLNLLARINREFDADFDLRAFKHVAVYNETSGRIEMYIESTRTQTVHVRRLGVEAGFEPGERIHTENSYKYTIAELTRLAASTGWVRTRTWLDRAEQFSSNLFVAVAG